MYSCSEYEALAESQETEERWNQPDNTLLCLLRHKANNIRISFTQQRSNILIHPDNAYDTGQPNLRDETRQSIIVSPHDLATRT